MGSTTEKYISENNWRVCIDSWKTIGPTPSEDEALSLKWLLHIHPSIHILDTVTWNLLFLPSQRCWKRFCNFLLLFLASNETCCQGYPLRKLWFLLIFSFPPDLHSNVHIGGSVTNTFMGLKILPTSASRQSRQLCANVKGQSWEVDENQKTHHFTQKTDNLKLTFIEHEPKETWIKFGTARLLHYRVGNNTITDTHQLREMTM